MVLIDSKQVGVVCGGSCTLGVIQTEPFNYGVDSFAPVAPQVVQYSEEVTVLFPLVMFLFLLQDLIALMTSTQSGCEQVEHSTTDVLDEKFILLQSPDSEDQFGNCSAIVI